MPVAKWDPFTNANTLQERINRMFDETFPQSAEQEGLSMCAWKPAVDIYETDGGIVITTDLPGVRKEDVAVEIKNNVLTVKGERRALPGVDESQYLRRERCFGTFQRSFNLKFAILPEKIKARFKDGMLIIDVPRPDEEMPKKISVNVD